MNFSLKNKWVLITGASSGFGAAAARAFGAEGAKLLLGARRVDRLKKVAGEARKAGALEAHVHELDVAETASVEVFMAWAKKKIGNRKPETGNLHVLVNNAGGAHGVDTVAEGRDADWEAMLQSNVLGVLRVTRAALPLWRPATAGGRETSTSVLSRPHGLRGWRGLLCGQGGRVANHPGVAARTARHGYSRRYGGSGLAETEFSMVRFRGDTVKAKKVYEGMNPLSAGRHCGNSGLDRQSSGACQH